MKKNKSKRWMTPQPRMDPRQALWEDDWLDQEPTPMAKTLRFSPTAWAKLLYFRDKSPNEVGGFGITAPDDLLFVQEFLPVKQEVTCVSVKFDDEAVSQFFDQQVDLGRKPEQFARIWLHTHPGDSPEPSTVDEETFQRVFGSCQWAVMAIVAQDDSTYARLSFNIGPGGQVLIPADVDFAREFGPTDHSSWEAEYQGNVRATEWLNRPALLEEKPTADSQVAGAPPVGDVLKEFERMDPIQRQLILDELADRPELWSGEEALIL
jgi:proteasome lid subunit RPN8/RPN11